MAMFAFMYCVRFSLKEWKMKWFKNCSIRDCGVHVVALYLETLKIEMIELIPSEMAALNAFSNTLQDMKQTSRNGLQFWFTWFKHLHVKWVFLFLLFLLLLLMLLALNKKKQQKSFNLLFSLFSFYFIF